MRRENTKKDKDTAKIKKPDGCYVCPPTSADQKWASSQESSRDVLCVFHGKKFPGGGLLSVSPVFLQSSNK